MFGGDFALEHYQPDAWKSSDGVNWDSLNMNVPWGNRIYHYAAILNDTFYIMGGQTMTADITEERFFNDVWKSGDGANWTLVTDSAPWKPRGIISGSVVFDQKIFLIGGGTYNTPHTPTRISYNDVWSTADGLNWNMLDEHAPFNGKEWHNVDTFDNKIWVIAGGELESEYTNHNTNNVWYSSDGLNWYELPTHPFTPRHAGTTMVYNHALYLVSGNNMEKDVWKLSRNDSSQAYRTQAAQEGERVSERNGLVATMVKEAGSRPVQWKLYPNPAERQLYIYLEGQEEAECSLYDVNGRMVKTTMLHTGTNSCSIQELAAGIYLYRITNGSELLGYGRLMKE
jgi:hypothetical protein